MDSGNPKCGMGRLIVFCISVACFFLQTGFVYLNYPSDGVGPKFSPTARHGLSLWRENNCQACHQIYGYGGFLGPDLTNLMDRRPYDDWEYVLTRGRKQMPAFDFAEEQREAIVAFLSEVSTTGVGVPSFTKVRDGVDANRLVENYTNETGESIDPAVIRGEQQLRENACNICHRPFAEGKQRSPDLTRALSFRSADYVRQVTLEGLGSMPAFDYLTANQVDDIVACLAWMNENRRALGGFYSEAGADGGFNWSAVPWFEY